MKIIPNELDPIRFRKDFTYARQACTFVNAAAGGRHEIARWILDLNSVAYFDQQHMPFFGKHAIGKLVNKLGYGNGPVLIMTDTLIYGVDSVVRYFEERCAPALQMIPRDDSLVPAMNWYRLCTTELDEQTNKYMLGRLLEDGRAFRAVLGQRAPLIERMAWTILFPLLRRWLVNDLRLDANAPEERFSRIQKIFTAASQQLSDGRRYLCGDRITIADLALASAGAPLVLPEEFGGAIPGMRQISQAYRSNVIPLRQTLAGQFIIRLYQQDRPLTIPQSELQATPGPLAGLRQRLSVFLNTRLPGLFSFVQRHFPLLKVPFVPLALATRNSLVVEVLSRDSDFTIEEINSHKMAMQKGAFFLGWDRDNPQFDREREFARSAVRPDDLDTIRKFLRHSCSRVVSANKHYGRIDVAATLCKPVLVQLIGSYFGVVAPSDRLMMEWSRILFYDLFENFFNNRKIHAKAIEAGIARRDWVQQLIVGRLTALNAGHDLPDNLLNRMILQARKSDFEWVDEDVINRNIGGLITGIFETTNKAVVHVLGVLLDRPDVLPGAIAAAVENDMEKMHGYTWEALRFLPVQPGVLRYCENDQVLSADGSREFKVKSKTTLLAMTAAAMFDPAAFPEPRSFDPARVSQNARYMNFGFGLHECFGRYVNTVTIPEFTAAVLRLKGIRRSGGRVGRGVGLPTLGFPNNFVLAFDATGFHQDND